MTFDFAISINRLLKACWIVLFIAAALYWLIGGWLPQELVIGGWLLGAALLALPTKRFGNHRARAIDAGALLLCGLLAIVCLTLLREYLYAFGWALAAFVMIAGTVLGLRNIT